MKRSLKYLAVLAGNFVILVTLLFLWTDKLELLLNDWVRIIELLKIVAFSLLSLVVVAILIWCLNKMGVQKRATKIKSACLITLFVCSYLYITYLAKLINNGIINRTLRAQISEKIKPADRLAHGTKAGNLSIEEYRQIEGMTQFPELPPEATNISYNYEEDGFLPDYDFTLIYFLPFQFKVDTFNHNDGRYLEYQDVEMVNGKKKITYSEGRQ